MNTYVALGLAFFFIHPTNMIGRIARFAFDVVLLSTTLAGIRRSAGITPNTDAIQSDEIKKWTKAYLDMGETCLDYAVAAAATNTYFKRTNGTSSSSSSTTHSK